MFHLVAIQTFYALIGQSNIAHFIHLSEDSEEELYLSHSGELWGFEIKHLYWTFMINRSTVNFSEVFYSALHCIK